VEEKMFMDILVALGDGPTAASYGLSMAQQFDADLTAVWSSAARMFEDLVGAETRYDLLIGQEVEKPEKEEADRRVEFLKRANSLGVNAHVITETGIRRGFSRRLSHLARVYDLVVVEQSESTQYAFNGGLIGSLVAGCGRPVLAVPFIQKDPASFEAVIVAWDASPSAARALGDALPILKRAGSVEIVTVANAGREHASPDRDDVVQHLTRHGVPAVARSIQGGDTTAETLLSYIADRGATLMVTGSYGHSRLAESLVGGATRTFLEAMTIPLFMSH
jgi:nucleotide-binding universal stress UspA family protein